MEPHGARCQSDLAREPAAVYVWRGMRAVRVGLSCVLGVAMIAIGVLHFVDPAPFVSIMPPWIPWHLAMVLISGAIEIALGVGVLVPRTRALSGWGLVALYVAVFPANVHMAVAGITPAGMEAPVPPWAAWGRLPLQAVLIAWAWWATRPEPRRDEEPPA